MDEKPQSHDRVDRGFPVELKASPVRHVMKRMLTIALAMVLRAWLMRRQFDQIRLTPGEIYSQ